MNKKLILGALAIVLLMSASPVNAAYDEDSLSGRVGQAWQSLKDFVVTNLGLDPLLDVDLRGSPHKVERPATTAAMFANAHFEGMRVESVSDDSQLSLVKGLFKSDDVDASNPSAQYFVLKLLKQAEGVEDDIDLYVRLQQSADETLTVSAIPYYMGDNGAIAIDLGKTNIGSDEMNQGQLLLRMGTPHSHNPNAKRLGLLVSTGG